jgi:uncharacterized protein
MPKTPQRTAKITDLCLKVYYLITLRYFTQYIEIFDFVLQHRGKTLAIEVKSGASQRASGVSAFQKKFGPHKTLLVGSEGLPWQTFLEINPTELF